MRQDKGTEEVRVTFSLSRAEYVRAVRYYLRKSHLVSEMGDHITDPLIEYAREYAGAERPDYFIFGHMHQPRDYSEGNLRVLCLGEWHSDPVYAVIDSEGNASLKKY